MSTARVALSVLLVCWVVVSQAAPVRAATHTPAAPAPAAAALPLWKVDATRSGLRFKATQAGAEFEGRFARFDARIQFDPARLAASRATVTIDVASVETLNAERDTALKSADWFDPARWPKATFTTQRIRAAGNGFVADGRLTIRNRAQPVRFAFTVARDAAGVRTLRGQARLSRLAFGLGGSEFATTEWVGDAVTVDVTVVATP